MPVETVINLVDALRQFRLLETDQYEEVIRTLAVRHPEPKALAKELLQRGWLTPFQVNQVFLGKGAELILGRYILMDRIGEGGMGQVYRARQTSIGRIVALKVIRKDRLRSEQAAKRFQREIRAASKLRHPNVVQAIDAEQVGDTHFFAMEFVEGIDLGKLVKTRGPVTAVEGCDFIRQAALGLQHAYEHNLIHRDIKPANLLVTNKDRVVKILDMGLVRDERGGESSEDSGSTLTQENAVMGTPDYLAPEQARDAHNVDIRADIYSLGCTLYYLVSGRVPFPGGQLGEKLIKHQLEQATPLRQLRPDVPAEVEEVVQKLMAKRPEERFQTPAEVADALTCLLSGERPMTIAPPSALSNTPVAGANPFVDLSGDTLPSGDTSTTRKASPDSSPSLPSRIASLATGTRTFTDKYIAPLLVGAEQKLAPLVQKAGVPAGQVRLVLLGVLGLFFLLMVGCWVKGRQSPVVIQEKQAQAQDVKPAIVSSPLDALSEGMIPTDERYEWLPKETVAIVGELRGRHPGMQRLVLSYDGKYLATTGPDNVIRIWNPNTLRNLFVLKGHTGAISALYFSPAKNVLLSAGVDKTIRFWDLTGLQPTESVLKDHDATIHSLSMSRDGKWLAAGGASKALFLYDMSGSTPEKKLQVSDFEEDVRAVALAPAGDFLFVGDSHTSTADTAARTGVIRIWDLLSLAPVELPKVTTTSTRLYALRFSHDGKTLLAGSSGVVHVFDVAAPKLTAATMPLPVAGIVTSFAFNRKGDVFAATGDKIDTYKWTVDGGWKPLKRTEGPGPPVGIEWFQDQKSLVTGHAAAPILYWTLKGAKLELTSNLVGHPGEAFALAFSADGKFLATSGGNVDQRVLVWSLENPAPQLNRTIAADTKIHALAFSPDGKYLAGASMNHAFVSVWDLTAKDPRAVPLQSNNVKGHTKGVRSLAFSPDGKVLITGGFGEICTWDFRKGIPREPVDYQLKHQDNWIGALVFRPDGKRFASAGFDGQIGLWEFTKPFPVFKSLIAKAHPQPITHLAFAADGKTLVSGGQDKAVRCWNLSDQSEVPNRFPGHNDLIMATSFNADGDRLITADRSGQLYAWRTDSAARNPNSWKFDVPITAALFAPDGRHVAVATAASATLVLRLQ